MRLVSTKKGFDWVKMTQADMRGMREAAALVRMIAMATGDQCEDMAELKKMAIQADQAMTAALAKYNECNEKYVLGKDDGKSEDPAPEATSGQDIPAVSEDKEEPSHEPEEFAEEPGNPVVPAAIPDESESF